MGSNKTPYALDGIFTPSWPSLLIVAGMVGGAFAAGNQNRQMIGANMRVEVEVLGLVDEPYRWVNEEHALDLQLRAGWIEAGTERSTMNRLTFREGEMGLYPRYLERWVGCADMEHLVLTISDDALQICWSRSLRVAEIRSRAVSSPLMILLLENLTAWYRTQAAIR
jgi:hypothetical protein